MTALNDKHTSLRYLATASIVAAFAALMIWLAFTLLRPTPWRSVTMATDPEGSLKAEQAERYRAFLHETELIAIWSRSQVRSKALLGCKTQNQALAMSLSRAGSQHSEGRLR
jgi:hypothetical protein